MGKQEFTYPSRKSEQREFFVPGVETPEESLEVWKSFAAVAAAYPATDRKVQRLVYTSNGKEFIAEVGYRTMKRVHHGSWAQYLNRRGHLRAILGAFSCWES